MFITLWTRILVKYQHTDEKLLQNISLSQGSLDKVSTLFLQDQAQANLKSDEIERMNQFKNGKHNNQKYLSEFWIN